MKWLKLISQDPCQEVWKKALLLPGKRNLEKSFIKELSCYFDLRESEVRNRCRNATKKLAKIWRRINPQVEGEIRKFYSEIAPQIYPFELLWYHTLRYDRTPLDAIIGMKYARKLEYKRCLDFGCGVASHGIVFLDNGFQVSLYDVSEDLMDFAKWRFQIRGLCGEFIKDEAKIENNKFGFILAFDVLEHLPNPVKYLRMLKKCLKKGGILCITMPESPDLEHPLHVSFLRDIKEWIERSGLRMIDKIWNGRIYQKLDYPDSHEGNSSQPSQLIKSLRYTICRSRVQPWIQKIVQTYHWQKAEEGTLINARK